MSTRVLAVILLLAVPATGTAMDRAEAIRLGRRYLAADNADDRERLLQELAAYGADYEPVLRVLRTAEFDPVPAGYLPEEHFTVRELLDRHPDDLLYFTIPKSYRPDRPTGLIVFMHGGGRRTSRFAPRYFMDFPDQADSEENSQLGDVFEATGMIAVGPSALWNPNSAYRWCLRDSDEYLADVIRECKARFNIDSDRVLLVGHSMGGFGAYHHVQRQPDRFAAVLVNAGSWSLGYWPAIRGTPLGIVHGAHDAVRDERWHYTDIEYARWTDRILGREKLDFVYYEHGGEHGIAPSRELLAKSLKSACLLRRDPCAPRIALASPVGFDEAYCFPVEHNRWLTLNEAEEGQIEYDELVTNGAEDFDDWRLTHRKSKRDGSSIVAANEGNNTIAVTTRNVARFTLWLHPQMVDVAKPVAVLVNGARRVSVDVEPSLATALESYSRRGDWGLIYAIKIECVVGTGVEGR